MASDSEVFIRNAARVIVIDRGDRILLIHTQLEPERPGMIWLTPGGGLNDGESAEDAARRELWEETGLEAGELHAVWDRRHAFHWRGHDREQRERYFLGRFDAPSVEFTALEEYESQQLLALRWWGAEAIQASDEIFVPLRLGELLPPLLRGELPSVPIKLGE
jgi:8-oxo-dGTP pyrophosphatase MutT (NUDIX family)